LEGGLSSAYLPGYLKHRGPVTISNTENRRNEGVVIVLNPKNQKGRGVAVKLKTEEQKNEGRDYIWAGRAGI
jgi:hypothetical protein